MFLVSNSWEDSKKPCNIVKTKKNGSMYTQLLSKQETKTFGLGSGSRDVFF